MGNEILHKLLFGSCPSQSLKKGVDFILFLSQQEKEKGEQKYTRKECTSGPKFCKTTLFTKEISSFDGVTLHSRVLIALGNVFNASIFV